VRYGCGQGSGNWFLACCSERTMQCILLLVLVLLLYTLVPCTLRYVICL
jgi:hypothetical protein